jgi:hypothetical protein
MNKLVIERLSKCYFVDYDEVINYFRTNKNLNSLEGFWKLSCNSISILENSITDNSFEISPRVFAIVFQDGFFYVCDYGKNYFNDSNFKANFKQSLISNIFEYECMFFKPEWYVKANAILIDDMILKYTYIVDKKRYKNELEENLLWDFIWTKITDLENF